MSESGNPDSNESPLSSREALRLRKRLSRLEGELAAVRQENRHLRRHFENLPLMACRIDRDGTILDCNRAALKTLGYSRKSDLVGRSLFSTFFAPAVRDETRLLLKRWAEGGRLRDRELSVVTREGEALDVLLNAHAVREKNKRDFSGILTFFSLGPRKRFESALRREKDRAQLYLQIAGVILMVIDREGRVVQINRKGCEVLGFREKQILGESWFERFVPPKRRREIKAYFNRMMRGEVEIPKEMENPVLTRTGEERLIAWQNTVIRDAKGRISATLSSGEDITLRRKAQEALIGRERTLTNLMNNLPGIAYLCLNDRYFTMKFVSRGCRRMTGYKSADLIDNARIAYIDLIHPEDRKRVREEVRKSIARNRAFRIEYRIVTARNEIRWVWEQGIGIPSVKGKASFIEGFITDITERKRAEAEQKRAQAALLASEERFRLLAENIMDVIWVLDVQGRFSYVSPSVERLRGYTPKEVMAQPLSAALTAASYEIVQKGFSELLERVGRGERYTEQHRYELEQFCKDGSTIWTEAIISALYDEKKGFLGVLGVTRDISKRKGIEEKITASLREKEVMLQEIHHRVKNNMQIMSSLLRLQASGIKDESTRRLLMESQGRIRSMALVHEKLYQSRDLSRIHFSEYVRSLVDHLHHTYRTDPDRIRLKISIMDLFLDINTAIPFGLLVNELVSNALQHAFPGKRTGQILINLSRDKKKDLRLCIQDDGVGLPAAVDHRNPDSLGLQLVLDLVNQLDARIVLDRTGGAAFCITIPSPEDTAPA